MSVACEIWLYGSQARGTADESSDTDLLVVGDANAVSDVGALYSYPRLAVSYYQWVEIEAMWSYGSLFLHHLRTEGIRLTPDDDAPSRLSRLLGVLPRFTRAAHDLVTFRRAADEARHSLDNHGWPDFELQVMATVVRHAAILGSYCIGDPDYGRETPFMTVGRHLDYEHARIWSLARSATQFRYLPLGHARWAKLSDGGLDWLAGVESFLDDLKPVIDEYEDLLRRAA
jgi:Nucleotidyltransferase domain